VREGSLRECAETRQGFRGAGIAGGVEPGHEGTRPNVRQEGTAADNKPKCCRRIFGRFVPCIVTGDNFGAAQEVAQTKRQTMEPETVYFLAPFVVCFGTLAIGLYLGVVFIIAALIALAWGGVFAAIEWT
jgi:hypothetical protein